MNREAMRIVNFQRYVIVLIAVCFLAIGCERKVPPPEDVIAMVRDNYLTSKEINSWLTALKDTSNAREARQLFILHWIEEELLYQAALDEGLLSDDWVIEKLNEIQRNILINRYLDDELQRVPVPRAEQVRNYYQINSEEFLWREPKLTVKYYQAPNNAEMQRLRADLLRGNLSSQLLNTIAQLDSGTVTIIGAGSTNPDVWRIVSRMKRGETSQLHILMGSNWVFQLLDRREIGEKQELEDVKDVIIGRLYEAARESRREEIIRQLRERYRRSGEFLLDSRWSEETYQTPEVN